MRLPRIKRESAAYYHCMSRIIERRFILGPDEREYFRSLMRALEGFSGLQILSYCIMSNHFHILLHVPERQPVSDQELVRRLQFIRKTEKTKEIVALLAKYRQEGNHAAAEDLKRHFTYRMYDVSEFFKALKQQFSQWYNSRNGRCGPLWEQRFKSVLVQGCPDVLLTMSAYIDLNPVRAGLVADPKDYRHCGYAEAVAGSELARKGMGRLLGSMGFEGSWPRLQCTYRKRLFLQGIARGATADGTPARPGFSQEAVRQVLDAGGEIPLPVLLHCRVRYFSDGVALGSRAFADEVFQAYRARFGPRRSSGARALRHAPRDTLFTLRALRIAPVSVT